MDELLREFVIESSENLETIDRDLMTLERDPNAPDVVASVFRAMHTIKGTAGFFDLPRIERLAHTAETLLGKVRDGVLAPTEARISALLKVADTLRSQLANLEETGAEGDADIDELIERLVALGDADADAASPVEADATPAAKPKPAPPKTTTRRRKPKAETASEAAVTAEAEPATPAPAADAAPGADRPHAAEASIRVDIGVLDELMTLVGELVLARNELLQAASQIDDRALAACASRVNLITGDLRERVLKTRMRPVKAVWSALPRLVRDTALSCGKQVQVRMEGEDTELDKTVLEAIKDPLTHCVRNSVDHGIESPEARVAAGKPAEGTLTLRASHENGSVVIEITDDGGGINIERVKAKALENGIHTPAQLEQMSDRAVADLIFAPGFSTAGEVTNLSGRGVGMDVVRTNVEKIGGTVDLNSVAGQGCTFTITIPLTLAIIPALIVGCAHERYAIPQTSVVEIVRVRRDSTDLEDMHGAFVYRLRGMLLPVVELRSQLQLRAVEDETMAHIVVLRGAGSPFGLIVDAVHSTEEIVVKPLGAHYANIGVFAGATVMGDGRVALILDVTNLAGLAHLGNGFGDDVVDDTDAEAALLADGNSVLIVQIGADRRLALPLERVARLEKFTRQQIERTGSQHVVQYRGDVLPIISLDEQLGAYAEHESDEVLVAVIAHGLTEVGMSVTGILEVSKAHPVDNGESTGYLSTAIVGGEVIDLVDLDAVLASAGFYNEVMA